jgi:hypothetical protein
MRWFFLSIIILYAWFSPGMAWLPALGAYSPSQAGLVEALVRCSVLIVILSLVHWLVHATSREQLIQGIYWLAKPLAWLRLKPEAMAVRLALVLDTVPMVQQKLEVRPSAAQAHTARTRRIVGHAVAMLDAALNEADRAEPIEIQIDIGRAPSLSDWMILSVVIMMTAMAVLLSA